MERLQYISSVIAAGTCHTVVRSKYNDISVLIISMGMLSYQVKYTITGGHSKQDQILLVKIEKQSK